MDGIALALFRAEQESCPFMKSKIAFAVSLGLISLTALAAPANASIAGIQEKHRQILVTENNSSGLPRVESQFIQSAKITRVGPSHAVDLKVIPDLTELFETSDDLLRRDGATEKEIRLNHEIVSMAHTATYRIPFQTSEDAKLFLDALKDGSLPQIHLIAPTQFDLIWDRAKMRVLLHGKRYEWDDFMEILKVRRQRRTISELSNLNRRGQIDSKSKYSGDVEIKGQLVQEILGSRDEEGRNETSAVRTEGAHQRGEYVKPMP